METAQYTKFEASDGEELAYQAHGQPGETTIILIHGFTGSSEYFCRNFDDLSEKFFVVAVDLRGHGHSTKARHGYHVSRLAVDLENLLSHLTAIYPDNRAFFGVGCSLGAAVLWSYSELFDSKHFAGMVFVDQAPLQDYIPGSWSITEGNCGVHDATSLAWAQATLQYAPDDFYRGLVEGCLAYRHQPNEAETAAMTAEQTRDDEEFFVNISRQGDPWWFGRLLADHTRYDHRDTIGNLIRCPCYVMAGQRSGSFPVKGIIETARLINQEAKFSLAEYSVQDVGHWMFYEEPEPWSQSILSFCKSSLATPEVQYLGEVPTP